MKSMNARYWGIVLAATIVGLIIRARIAYNGSIWADEGSFLNVLAAPSWSEMISFLKLHESHPPLFYLLMRGWSRTVGSSDRLLMIAPILLGAAIVPAMFLAGRELFSARVGALAACMAAVASQLTEHASQIRPYGLLSLSALASVAALAVCVRSGTRRAWIIYVASTATMLYTHNWAWMIVAGELGAAIIAIRNQDAHVRRRLIRTMVIAWITILALYAPWLPSFLFQSRHAGHGALPIEGILEYTGYFLFSVYRILESLVIGRVGEKQTVAVAELVVATAVLALTTLRYRQRDGSLEQTVEVRQVHFVLHVLLCALGAALILSPFNNLMLPRVVATVMPMLILASAYWINQIVSHNTSRLQAQLAAVVFSIAIIANVFETAALLVRPRSNVRKIADAVRVNAHRNDLLIVAPEWFAASFDHYFPPSIEQIDYPYDGRSAMIDFSNIWETRTQSIAVLKVQNRIKEAAKDDRRIWFVFERRYLKKFTPQELDKAYRHRMPGAFSVQEVRRIRSVLDSLYGLPRVFQAKDPLPINDELIAYLYER